MSKAKKKRTHDRDHLGTALLVGLVVLIALVGLLFTKAMKDVTLIKGVIFYWAVTMMFLGLLGVYLFKGELLIPRSKMMVPLLVYIGLSLISMALTRYRYASAQEVMTLLCCGMLVFVTARAVTDERGLLWMVGAIAAVGGLSCIYGILQHHGVDPIFGDSVPLWVDKKRSFATMGHPNFYASFLVLAVPILLSLFFWSTNPVVKGVLVPLICAVVLSLFYTSSRGAWLGYVASLPICFFLSIVNKRLRLIVLGPILCIVTVMAWLLLSERGGGYVVLWALPFWLVAVLAIRLLGGGANEKPSGGKTAWAALLLVAVVLASILFVDHKAVGGRVQDAYETEKGSVRTRKVLWAGTWTMFKAKPVFGWGVGTFGIHFPRFRDPVTAGNIAPNTLHAHCEYLETGAEVGVIGLAVFLWMLVAFAAEGVRKVLRERSELQRMVMAGLLAGCAAILFHAVVSVTTRWIVGRFFLWLGIGLTIAAGNMVPSVVKVQGRKKKGGASREKAPGFHRFRVRPMRSPAAWTVFVVLSLGVAVAAGVLGGRVFQSAALAKKGEDWQEAAEMVAREKNAEDGGPETRWRENAIRVKAINLYEEATALNRYNLSAYYKLGHCYNLQRDFKPSLRAYRHIEKLSPDYSDLHLNLGIVYANMRRWEESREELTKALSLKIGPLTRLALARAYENLRFFDRAEEQYNSLIEEHPRDVRGLNGLAALYVRQGKNAAAAEFYRKALEIDSKDADARLGMGLLCQVLASQLRSQGQAEAALVYHRKSIAELEKAVVSRPAGVPARAALALVYAEVGRFEDAERQLGTALKIEPDNALAHLNLGKVRRMKGDVEKAREAFRETIRLDGRGPWAIEAARELRRMGVE